MYTNVLTLALENSLSHRYFKAAVLKIWENRCIGKGGVLVEIEEWEEEGKEEEGKEEGEDRKLEGREGEKRREREGGRRKGERGEKLSRVQGHTLYECFSESRWAASSNRGQSEVTTTSLWDETQDVDKLCVVYAHYIPAVCGELCTEHTP